MVKTKPKRQAVLTQAFLVKQLSALERRIEHQFLNFQSELEKRLDQRFEMQADSFKSYLDGRFALVNQRLDGHDDRFDRLETRMGGLERKLSVNTDGLVDMIQRLYGRSESRLDNHERRITALEGSH